LFNAISVVFNFDVVASPAPAPVTKSDQPQAAADEPKPYCSQFDLTKRIPASILEEAKTEIIQWSDTMDEGDDHDDYQNLLNKIRKVVLDGNFSSAIPVAPGTPRNALRVAIHSLASPSWQSKSPYVSPCTIYIILFNLPFSRIYTSFAMLFEVYFDFLLAQLLLLSPLIFMTKSLM
jgi:hypothetical protein